MHVDLPYAIATRGQRVDDASFDASARKLVEGRVSVIVAPLFVEDAWSRDPKQVRESYESTLSALLANAPRVRVVLGFEGADGFADDASAIDSFFARGACVVGLVHDHDNRLAGSSTDPRSPPPGKSLTDEGRALAERVAARGAVLDVAHASDASARELVAIAQKNGAPVVDSHTGMRALAATRRNVPDDLALAIAQAGGVVAISMHAGHVARGAPEGATLDDVVAHLDYAKSLVGAEHVAVGSDFAGAIVPVAGATGEASWPALASRLRARGWTAREVSLLLSGNALRVLARCPR